jgi:hypothetical protein
MPFHKTTSVARLLDVPYSRLFDLLRSRQLAAPQKDSSGDYIWTDEDIERARAALAQRQRRKSEVAHV